jgi:hypothetical protein
MAYGHKHKLMGRRTHPPNTTSATVAKASAASSNSVHHLTETESTGNGPGDTNPGTVMTVSEASDDEPTVWKIINRK